MAKVTQNALLVNQEKLKQLEDNINRSADKDARILDSNTISSRIGPSGTLFVNNSLTRAINPLLESTYLSQITNLESHNTKVDYLRAFQSIIGTAENTQDSAIVKSIDGLFAQAKLLEANDSSSMRQAFIDKAEDLASKVSNLSEQATKLQLAGDNQMKEDVSNVNNTLKSLFELNQQMRISSAPIKLHDMRDNFIKKLRNSWI